MAALRAEAGQDCSNPETVCDHITCYLFPAGCRDHLFDRGNDYVWLLELDVVTAVGSDDLRATAGQSDQVLL